MKARHIILRVFRAGLLLLPLAVLAGGCATSRINWAERVGTYTYDQAVVEYGPPDKQATLQDGSVVADWMIRRGYAYPSYPGFAHGPYPYWHAPVGPTYFESPDYYLRLVFGPDTKLTTWKNFTK
jgi:hypothetical protein